MVSAGEVHRTEAEGGGEVVATVQQVPPSDRGQRPQLGRGEITPTLRKPPVRAFLSANNCANDGERRMAEGLGNGAGLDLHAVPILQAFTCAQETFQRI